MFNELSVNSLSPDKYAGNDKMKLFSEAIAEARKKGFRNVRSPHDSHQIQLAANYTLHDWLINKEVSEILRNNLYGMLILPFIRDEDEETVAHYVNADFYFEDTANGFTKVSCQGLAAAHLRETLSVSLQSNAAWKKNCLEITMEENEGSFMKQVANVFSKECFAIEFIKTKVENLGDLDLKETKLAIKDKKIHLTSHHGKKELGALWNRIKNSPYVIEGLSIEWGGKRFIRRTYANGAIEIVDNSTTEGFALLVQTTGTNLRETNAIADILKERYE